MSAGLKSIHLKAVTLSGPRYVSTTSHFLRKLRSHSYGFVDPSLVLRGCHLIPAFAVGKDHPEGTWYANMAKDSKDWKGYYVNRCGKLISPLLLLKNISGFADRDMTMRYHWGMGIGHMYSHGQVVHSQQYSAPVGEEDPDIAQEEAVEEDRVAKAPEAAQEEVPEDQIAQVSEVVQEKISENHVTQAAEVIREQAEISENHAYFKLSRLFKNVLEKGMLLQFLLFWGVDEQPDDVSEPDDPVPEEIDLDHDSAGDSESASDDDSDDREDSEEFPE